MMACSNNVGLLAFVLNVASSVVIVFANKILMAPTGHNFRFATTLTALHFLTCAASMSIGNLLKPSKGASSKPQAQVPLQDALLFAGLSNLAIVSLNASLLVNTVGFYQIAKLLVPCVSAVIEMVVFKKTFPCSVLLCIAAVVAGVGTVTVTDIGLEPLGIIIAIVSAVASSLSQIMCGLLQARHGVTAGELLGASSGIQAMMLIIAGPYMDYLLTKGHWVYSYEWSTLAVGAVALSCALAVLVNISQYMVLGKFSAVTYSVLGHSKTVIVIIGSYYLLHEQMTLRKLMGVLVAICGMVAYAHFSGVAKGKGSASNNAAPSAKLHGITAPMLPVSQEASPNKT